MQELELERLALGEPNLAPLQRISAQRTAKSMLSYLKAWNTYRRGGFPAAQQYLDSLQHAFVPICLENPDDTPRHARRVTVPLRLVGRLVSENPICLASSISLAAGLIAFGFEAYVAIGKRRSLGEFPFHAWVEVSGTPINDEPSVHNIFALVLKHPIW